jgi:hypothetical protein
MYELVIKMGYLDMETRWRKTESFDIDIRWWKIKSFVLWHNAWALRWIIKKNNEKQTVQMLSVKVKTRDSINKYMCLSIWLKLWK